MSANRFGRSAKNLPCAGLLSASDLHRMLKHGQDVVGMGPSPAERGEAPLGSSVLQSSQSSHPVGGSTEEVEGSDTLRRQNQSLLEQSSAPGGAVAHTRHIGSGGGKLKGPPRRLGTRRPISARATGLGYFFPILVVAAHPH